MDARIIAVVGLVGGAIGWFSSQYWQHRQARRQAALDAGETLGQKKKLFEEMLSNEEDTDRKQVLRSQLDDVNHALLGLRTERVRRLLREAGLPDEEILIADGREQLSPEQATSLEEAAAEVAALPVTLSVGDLWALGNAYYYSGQYQKAMGIFDRILELDPANPFAKNNYGLLYREMGKYEEAIADFNRALKLGPDDPGTLHNRAVTYSEMEKYEEALADYDRSLELRPDAPNTLNGRGVTYCHLGKYEEAMVDYNRALELMPEDAGTLYNLACLFSLWEKVDEALGYLGRAIAGDREFGDMALIDDDFNNIRKDPRFKKLIEPD